MMSVRNHFASLWLITCAALHGSVAQAADDEAFRKLWSKLPVGEALEQAQRNHQPVLLYWGAVWCPPCNQLKSQVFSHPGFSSATEGFVRIYLDGDEAGAQEWGEKLAVSGYPTVLVLTPDKPKRKGKEKSAASSMKEQLRLAEFVNFDEFKALITPALEESRKSKGGSSAVLEGVRKRALSGKASLDDWRLLAYTWDPVETSPDPQAKAIQKAALMLRQLLQKCPHEEIRGLLAARLLNLETDSPRELLKIVTANDSSLVPARGPFVAGAMSWIERAGEKESVEVATLALGGAARLAAGGASTSEVDRLQATALHWEIANWLKAKTALTVEEWEKIRKEAAAVAVKTEAASKSAFDRHAIVTDSAMLLSATGNVDKAKEILQREAASSDTPWYYQSSLAMIHLEAKEWPAALEWSRKARQSAQGNATRIQWMVSDLVLQSKVPPDALPQGAFEQGLRDWLDLAKTMPDGFSGRNAMRAKKVKTAIDTLKDEKTRARVMADWRATCAMLKKEAQRNCLKNMR
ncbi:MAG: hypothetical protein RIQ81_1455 [Pseudomonadota bacterium]